MGEVIFFSRHLADANTAKVRVRSIGLALMCGRAGRYGDSRTQSPAILAWFLAPLFQSEHFGERRPTGHEKEVRTRN
jgi:hypothetical protein